MLKGFQNRNVEEPPEHPHTDRFFLLAMLDTLSEDSIPRSQISRAYVGPTELSESGVSGAPPLEDSAERL